MGTVSAAIAVPSRSISLPQHLMWGQDAARLNRLFWYLQLTVRGAEDKVSAEEEVNVKQVVYSITVVAFALGISPAARAQTRITLLAPDPVKDAVTKIVKAFEMKTGDTVQESWGSGVGTRRTVQEGGAKDVTLLFAPFDAALKTGNVDKSSQTVVAQVRLAIAVKAGIPKPDISNPAAVKKLLLNAKSIATVDPAQGSTGGAAMQAFEKMGIIDQVKPKLKLYRGGDGAQKAVVDGEAEVAVGPYLSAIEVRNPPAGLQVLGALPPAASTPIDITGWVAKNVPDKKAALELLEFFKSKEAAPIWGEAHIFPVTR
jgi:molybdate transport system substrate-binding protein